MRALERVKVGEVEEVSYPAVDAQQVERGGRDEVQRLGIGVKERADVRQSVQCATRLSGVHEHADRGGVEAWTATASAAAANSGICIAQVCTCLRPCAACRTSTR